MNARIEKLEAAHASADADAEDARDRGDIEGYQDHAARASRIGDEIDAAYEEAAALDHAAGYEGLVLSELTDGELAATIGL